MSTSSGISFSRSSARSAARSMSTSALRPLVVGVVIGPVVAHVEQRRVVHPAEVDLHDAAHDVVPPERPGAGHALLRALDAQGGAAVAGLVQPAGDLGAVAQG